MISSLLRVCVMFGVLELVEYVHPPKFQYAAPQNGSVGTLPFPNLSSWVLACDSLSEGAPGILCVAINR